jgi:rod shape-determining protein MreC
VTVWVRYRYVFTGVAAVIVLVVLAGLTAYYRDQISILERQALQALSPIQQTATRAGDAVRGAWQSLAELGALRSENARLRAELDRLAALEPQLAELTQENLRLRQMLDFSPPAQFRAVAARVVGRSLANWYSTVEVDRGADHGVQAGQPVVTQAGLVGRIVRVTGRTATVLLLVDPQSGVGAEVIRSREAGVLVGAPGFWDRGQMRMFSRDADVVAGDLVLTSGLGDIFPRGLPVGRVDRVRREDQGLLVVAEVEPAVDFGRLEEVFILLPK